MIFRVLIVLSVLFLACGTELRTVAKPQIRPMSKLLKENHVKFQNAITFPSNPTYAIANNYDDATCATQTGGSSYVLNTCLVGSSSSVMYTCSGSTITLTSYSDLTCTTPSGTDPYTVGACNSDGDGGSFKVTSCSSSDPYGYGGMVNFPSFQDSGCSQVLASSGVLNDYCYADDGTSYKWEYPQYNVYAGTTCTGTPLTVTVPETCTAEGALDDEVANNAYTKYVYNYAPRTMHMGVAAVVSMVLAIVTLF